MLKQITLVKSSQMTLQDLFDKPYSERENPVTVHGIKNDTLYFLHEYFNGKKIGVYLTKLISQNDEGYVFAVETEKSGKLMIWPTLKEFFGETIDKTYIISHR